MGYLIYRVDSRSGQRPMESVQERNQTAKLLRSKMEQKTKSWTAPVHTDLDDGWYFGPAGANSVAQQSRRAPNQTYKYI